MTTNTTSPETTPESPAESPFLAFCEAVERAFDDIRKVQHAAARDYENASVVFSRTREILQNYGVLTPDVNPDGVGWLPGAVRKLCEERDKLAGCLKCVTKSRDWWREGCEGKAAEAGRARRWCVAFGVLFVFASVGLFAFAAERLFTSP